MEQPEKDAFLAHATLPQFKSKVRRAKEEIESAIALGNSYVGISWGKDSIVLLHLCQMIMPNIPAIHIKTPFQELLNNYEEVKTTYCRQYEPSYFEVDIEKECLIPQAIKTLKLWENYPVAITGVRAEENPKKRGGVIKRYGLTSPYQSGARRGSWRCWPLGYWKWRDVWAYICINDLPYLASYDHPLEDTYARSRTTNIMPFTQYSVSHRKGRIEKMKMISPKAHQFLKENYPELC